MYTYTYKCMYIYIYIHIIYIYTHVLHIDIDTYVCIYIHVYVYCFDSLISVFSSFATWIVIRWKLGDVKRLLRDDYVDNILPIYASIVHRLCK